MGFFMITRLIGLITVFIVTAVMSRSSSVKLAEFYLLALSLLALRAWLNWRTIFRTVSRICTDLRWSAVFKHIRTV